MAMKIAVDYSLSERWWTCLWCLNALNVDGHDDEGWIAHFCQNKELNRKGEKEKPQRKLTMQPDRAPTGARKTSRKKIDICDADDESHRQFDIRLFSCNTTSFFFTVPSSPSSLLLYCLICCFSERNGDVVLDISFSSLQFHCATSSVFYQPEYDHYFD